MSDSKNESAWLEIFERYNIVQQVNRNGLFVITANQIKEFREPRLMTKFDFKKTLPLIFKSNKLAILPITRGRYTIGKFKAYHDFEDEETEIIGWRYPDNIQSIDFENITSEATAINAAFASGILHDFLEEEVLYPTVNGRMSSGTFSFEIKERKRDNYYNINVDNSQIEIDGGFEGINSLALIEAKNSISDDFLIRQLYYPFRLWNNKIVKDVRTVYMTYSNGIYTLNEYMFEHEDYYNSLELVRKSKYSIQPSEITIENIIDIYNSIGSNFAEELQNIPFPQANSFDRVINLCEILKAKGSTTKEEITNTYDFDVRQSDYYTNACKYLGLIEKFNSDEVIRYRLTSLGFEIMESSFFKRNISFIRLILQHRVFTEVLRRTIKLNGEIPSTHVIAEYMYECNVNVSGDKTFERRASTVKGWINWILRFVQKNGY